MKSRVPEIRREQKTALFFHQISSLIQQLSIDEPELLKIYVTKVKLSKDYNICNVFFSTYMQDGKQIFDKALETLILYKPSLRTALAHAIGGRYAADLVFRYDEEKEKEHKINALLNQVAKQEEEFEAQQANENPEDKEE